MKLTVRLVPLLLAALVSAPLAIPCTRILYTAKDGTVITGRSMDWGEDMHSNMWALPRGMERDGGGGANTLRWKSKFGSLIVSGYDIGTSEGMNEKGLVVNMLALVETDFGKPNAGEKTISISTWAQYILDNHETVAAAVTDLRKEAFRVQTVVLPTGNAANMHLAISDATGDSAICEYVGGNLVIHHGKEFRVMTNSPTYEKQLAIQEYWKEAGNIRGFLPGTPRAADRFTRALFLLNAIPVEAREQYLSGAPQQKFGFQAIMSVLSVMRSVGTPLGIVIPNEPQSSSTIWRTVSDSTHRVVVFDSALTPSTFWVPLDELNWNEGSPVKKLTLAGGKTYSGNAVEKFVEAKLFEFARIP